MCLVSPSPAFLNSSVPKHHTDHTPGCMGAAPTAAMGWSSTKTQPNPYFKQSSAENGNWYWRVTPWIMPCVTIVPVGGRGALPGMPRVQKQSAEKLHASCLSPRNSAGADAQI